MMKSRRLGTSRRVACWGVGVLVVTGLSASGAAAPSSETEGWVAADEDAAMAPSQQSGSEGRAQPLPQIGTEDQLAVFELERGAYFSTDLGVFITLGGENRYSNVQPFLALKLGYDMGRHFSVQGSFSAGYAAGDPVTRADVAQPQTATENYEMLNMGIEFVGAIRPKPRFAIEPKVGVGITRVTPQMPSLDAPMKPHLVAGIDFKYLTLLTDFTAGLTVNAYRVIGLDVVGIGTGAVVRYTF